MFAWYWGTSESIHPVLGYDIRFFVYQIVRRTWSLEPDNTLLDIRYLGLLIIYLLICIRVSRYAGRVIVSKSSIHRETGS